MSELPKGWSIAMIGQIADINPRHPRNLEDSLAVTFVRMPALSETSWKFESTEERLLGEVRKGFTHFAEGDVLFAKITPCMENGKAAVALDLINGLGCGTTELHVMRPYGCVDSKYLFYFVHQESFREQAARNFTGTAGQLRVPVTFIKDAEIPIPPLNEQRRIVAKLEKLLSRVHSAQERLATIPDILKRFRQSVLAAACSGRLTADWRSENVGESGAELLKQIEVSRLQRASSKKETAQIKRAFTNLPENGSDLPSSWVFCTIGAIGTVLNGSTPSRKISSFWGGNIPWVSSGEVRNNIIRTTRESITEDGLNNSSTKLLPRGTILLAMIGEGKTRGQSAILEIDSTINQNIAAVDISHQHLAPEYLWRWFQYQYETTREVGSGSGPQALNCQRVRELPLHLPPLKEQHEIIRRVEALFKTSDALEARYLKAKAHVDKLTQSILAKAFRGELVPQDPNDEPASVLLKRIDQNRNGNEVPRRRSRK